MLGKVLIIIGALIIVVSVIVLIIGVVYAKTTGKRIRMELSEEYEI